MTSNPRRAIAVLAAFTFLTGGIVQRAAAAEVISVEVKGGKVVSGPKVTRLKRDDPVTLTILSDRADELHVHGYDLHLKLVPNQAATLQFVAKRTGRFSYELHKSGTELGVLEIYPK